MMDGPAILQMVFANAPFLQRKFSHDKASRNAFIGDQHALAEKSLARIRSELNALTGALPENSGMDSLARLLKQYKYRQYLRLTARELLLHDQSEIYREFSHLAQIIGEIILTKLYRAECVKRKLSAAIPCPVAIIALGKLGGMELNYSSDIDVMGLYETDAPFGGDSTHEFASKILADWGNILSAGDENGFLHRVDWDLRPEGKSGVLANSLPALETYYSAFAEEWERQAFIKARVLCGNLELGEKFIAMMTPFVYRKHLDAEALTRTLDMKAKITAHHESKTGDGIDIKNGPGGLRDIEFIAQGLQLVHGGAAPDLRHTGTLPALEALNRRGFLDVSVAQRLAGSYRYLRRTESALQMDEERQTHVVNTTAEASLKIARRLGIGGDSAAAVSEFRERLQNHRDYVSLVFMEMYDAR